MQQIQELKNASHDNLVSVLKGMAESKKFITNIISTDMGTVPKTRNYIIVYIPINEPIPQP